MTVYVTLGADASRWGEAAPTAAEALESAEDEIAALSTDPTERRQLLAEFGASARVVALYIESYDDEGAARLLAYLHGQSGDGAAVLRHRQSLGRWTDASR